MPLKRKPIKRPAAPLALVEVFAIRIPDLVIVDGVLAMEGNGPASKDLINLGKIMAGDDSVALDTVVAYMMGFPDLPRTTCLGLH